MKWASLSKAEIQGAIGPLQKAYKSNLGMGATASSRLVEAMGLGDFHHELNVERLMAHMKFLMGPDEEMAGLVEAGIHIEQMWAGIEEPVLESTADVRG